ncbi:MAG TPA: hypothetical protein IAB62_08755 [Candidatus Coprocola pullicola]|nr:hypothetical protein [Candidatus Coprocola pullicola]
MPRDDKRAEKAFVPSYLAEDCNHAGMRIGQKDTKEAKICLYCAKRL